RGRFISVLPCSCRATATPGSHTLSLHDALPILREQYTDNPRKAQELIRRISKNAHVCHVSQTPVMAGLIRHIMELMRRVEEYYRSEEHTSELQSRFDIVCRLLLEQKKNK